MMDQHTRFSSRGLSTEFVGEAQTDPSVCGKVLRGEVQLAMGGPVQESICTDWKS